MVRLPGCDGGGETTVLAHLRSVLTAGIGMKPHDLLGVWSCHHCHNLADGRIRGFEREFIDKAMLEGMYRTQAALIAKYQLIFVEK